jgi:ankyrin repeat protein
VLEGQEGHTQDINNYLESALRIGSSASAQKIRKDLQEKSSGVFMWIVLVVDILNEEYDGGRMHALERRLKQIPADLHDLFQDILTRDSNDKEELILCLQWVLFAKQPLQPEQLYSAILAGTEPDALATQHHQEVTFETIRKFLLRSSKGLTEITKTKNRKVQFIHESVRDFLLKENGLSKIWPEFANNFQGQSHDRLKQCCLNYISIDIATPLKLPDNLPRANSRESTVIRVSAVQTFPFLEYAIHNVLYHAETAEDGGISQVDFLNSFPLPRWVKLDNLFEKHEVRRHRQGVSLLYILAELNMTCLIRILGSASCCMHVEDERYGCPLLAAVAMNRNEAVEMFLESIEVQPQYSNLVTAVGRRQVQDRLDQRYATRNLTYAKSKDVVGNAIEFGHGRVVARAIASGKFQIDSQNSSARSILRWASRIGFETLVKLLLAGDSTLLDSVAIGVYTPLQIAAKEGNLGVIEVLLEAGADIDAVKWSDTPLYLATSEGHKKAVALLLDKGADANARGGYNSNAIQEASYQGNREIVDLLIEKGADVNAIAVEGNTALQKASYKGHKEIVELLIDRGADVHALGGFYGNGVQAASLGGRKEILELLIEKGVAVDVQGGKYGSAVQAASYNGHKKCLELLLGKGADVNVQGGYYSNALKAACTRGHKEIVELLLEKGADIGDAVEIASRNGRKEIVTLLLERGADVNFGKAVEEATANGYKDMVKLLLERGGNVDVGKALQVASDRGQTEMVALLQKYSVAEASQ